MYGFDTYGETLFGAFDGGLYYGSPSLATTSTQSARTSGSLVAGHNDTGIAIALANDPTPVQAYSTRSPAYSGEKTLLISGAINPYLYDTLLYNTRVLENALTKYRVVRANFSGSAAGNLKFSTSDIDLSRGWLCRSYTVDSLNHIVSVPCTKNTCVPEIFTTHDVLFMCGALSKVKDDLTQYNATANSIVLFSTVEGMSNPPIVTTGTTTASIPGVSLAHLSRGNDYGMVFPATRVKTQIMPLDLITIPSGDPTGLNGLFYTTHRESVSFMYGCRSMYNAHGGNVYLGIVNNRFIFIDRNKVGFAAELFKSGTMDCSGPHPEHFADYLFGLHEPTVTSLSYRSPAPYGDGRTTVLYGVHLYAGRDAVYAASVVPDVTTGSAEVVMIRGELTVAGDTALYQAFKLYTATTESSIVVPRYTENSWDMTRFMSAVFSGDRDQPLEFPVVALPDFDLLVAEVFCPVRVGESASSFGVHESTYGGYSYSTLQTHLLSQALGVRDTLPYSHLLAAQVNEVVFGFAEHTTVYSLAVALFATKVLNLTSFHAPAALHITEAHTVSAQLSTLDITIDMVEIFGVAALVLDVCTPYFVGIPVDYNIIDILHAYQSCRGGAVPVCGVLPDIAHIDCGVWKPQYAPCAAEVLFVSAMDECTQTLAGTCDTVDVAIITDVVSVQAILESHIEMCLRTALFTGDSPKVSAGFVSDPVCIEMHPTHSTLHWPHAWAMDWTFTTPLPSVNKFDSGTGCVLHCENIPAHFVTYPEHSLVQMHVADSKFAYLICRKDLWADCGVDYADTFIVFPVINLQASVLWYSVEITYDYDDTDPREMAFIF